MTDRPAFEIRRIGIDGELLGEPILIYSNGRVGGIKGGYTVFNRIPQEIEMARADERAKLQAKPDIREGSQWTPEQIAEIKRRGQPIVPNTSADDVFDAADKAFEAMNKFFKSAFRRR